MPHQRLLYKLEYYGITGTTLEWIRSWLTTRTQTVVVDGEASSEAPRCLRSPPGHSARPTTIFAVYKRYRWRSKLKHKVVCWWLYPIPANQREEGCWWITIRPGHSCWMVSQMAYVFQPKECSVLRITQKKKTLFHQYLMCGEELTHADQQTYLGLELTKDLSWSPHIQKIVTKANRNLNMIRRNLGQCSCKIKCQAYLSLVRPILEYGQTVWDPYQLKHIDQVERVQRKAIRYVMTNYDQKASVTAMRENLEWPTLQQRRCVARLTMFHKIMNNQSAVKMPDYVKKLKDHSEDHTPRATSTSRVTLIPTSIHTFHEQSDVGTSYQDS